MCNTRKSARCASLGMLVSLVADSYEKQTIASHKGSKIKAWKEKAVEKKKERKTRKEKEREREEREGRGKKAPFNALGSTVHGFLADLSPRAVSFSLTLFDNTGGIRDGEVYDSARIRAEITPISILIRVQTGNRRKES